MSFADAINYAHEIVIECGKLDLPHKMLAHNAIYRIEATYKSELQAHVKNFESTINILVAENARLKAENAKMRKALKKIAMRPATDFVSEFEANVATALAALAAEGGAK